MPFYNSSATATTEQVEAAKETISLVNTIGKFISQSEVTERSNKKLTCFVIGLSIIQTVFGVASFFYGK